MCIDMCMDTYMGKSVGGRYGCVDRNGYLGRCCLSGTAELTLNAACAMDMCMDMCMDICMDRCIDRCMEAYGHVYGVYGHGYRDVYGVVWTDV